MLHLMALIIALFGGGPISDDIVGGGPPGAQVDVTGGRHAAAPVVAADVTGGGPAGNASTNETAGVPPPLDDVTGGGPAGH